MLRALLLVWDMSVKNKEKNPCSHLLTWFLFFWCVVEAPEICPHSKFPGYSIVLLLTIVIMLYLILHIYSSYIIVTLYPLASISPFSPAPALGNHHSTLFY